jgi:orotidine 5''-phosphate decarboxylase, subfamily 2
MNIQQLITQVKQKKTYLCVGLDTDINKIPKHLQSMPNAVLNFNKAVIDATKDCCVSYKINTAFYEAQGVKGWDIIEKTVDYIGSSHFIIADAKRGDIGNTSAQYAKTFFKTYSFDAVTVAPYMGEDSVRPFLEYDDKVTIVLGLTSNAGAKNFELQKVGPDFLYEKVIKTVATWGSPNNLMFVVGATQASEFANIRKIVPEHFLLVPGVGTQGGNLQEVSHYGMNKHCGLLVNVSRAVIYAGADENFADDVKLAAQKYQFEMSEYLEKYL